jgi:hypothetical protein
MQLLPAMLPADMQLLPVRSFIGVSRSNIHTQAFLSWLCCFKKLTARNAERQEKSARDTDEKYSLMSCRSRLCTIILRRTSPLTSVMWNRKEGSKGSRGSPLLRPSNWQNTYPWSHWHAIWPSGQCFH